MRSEEEKTRDIYIHDMRSSAADIIEGYSKISRKAMIAAVIGAVLLFCGMISFIFYAYDTERIVLLAILIISYFFGVALVYFVSGAIILKSFTKFIVVIKYIYKWDAMLQEIDRIEKKQLQGDVYPGDIVKLEEKLLSLCDKIKGL